MRTTLVINDDLFTAAKKKAAERQCSLSLIVNDALRLALGNMERKTDMLPFKIPLFQGEGAVIDTNPEEFSRFDEKDDLVPFG